MKRCQNDPAISKLCKGGITYQTVAHLQRKYVKKTKKEPKDGDENSAEETAEEGDDDDKNDEDDDFMDPINDTAANEFKVRALWRY